MRTRRRTQPCGPAVALLAAFVLAAAGCDTLVPEPYPNTPLGNFDALWDDLDAHYALFGVRGVDWDSLRTVYRPRAAAAASPEDLHAVLCELLGELGDGHVALAADGVGSCNAGYAPAETYFPDGTAGEFRHELAMQRAIVFWYLSVTAAPDSGFLLIDPELTEGRRLLYLGLERLGDGGSTPWHEIFARLSAPPACDGLVVDVRGNPGGLVARAADLADALADAPRLYLTVSRRDGPGHDDLATAEEFMMTPAGTGWGRVPLVVLTDPFSASAAEWFLLAMRERPRTTIVGTPTRGIFSGRSDRVLPNGWEYSSSGSLIRDAHGVCWEGVGVPPDSTVRNTREANIMNRDLALDAALVILGGTPPP